MFVGRDTPVVPVCVEFSFNLPHRLIPQFTALPTLQPVTLVSQQLGFCYTKFLASCLVVVKMYFIIFYFHVGSSSDVFSFIRARGGADNLFTRQRNSAMEGWTQAIVLDPYLRSDPRSLII